VAIKTILVPTDFSAASSAALTCAKQFAEAFGASLHLLHVLHDPLGRPAVAEAMSSATIAGVVAQLEEEAREGMKSALSADEAKAYALQTTIEVGAPVTKIVEYIVRHGVDLVVMGTHGRGAFAHVLFGSVAERVVRLADCPVVTVRPAKA